MAPPPIVNVSFAARLLLASRSFEGVTLDACLVTSLRVAAAVDSPVSFATLLPARSLDDLGSSAVRS